MRSSELSLDGSYINNNLQTWIHTHTHAWNKH